MNNHIYLLAPLIKFRNNSIHGTERQRQITLPHHWSRSHTVPGTLRLQRLRQPHTRERTNHQQLIHLSRWRKYPLSRQNWTLPPPLHPQNRSSTHRATNLRWQRKMPMASSQKWRNVSPIKWNLHQIGQSQTKVKRSHRIRKINDRERHLQKPTLRSARSQKCIRQKRSQ